MFVCFIIGVILEPIIITLASLLMVFILYFLIRDILKNRGIDTGLLDEYERRQLFSLSKLSIFVLIPISLPLIFIYSQIYAHNEWFAPIWILTSSLLFIIIDTIIYIYLYKYLMKKKTK